MSLLVPLYDNHRTLEGVGENDLYQLVIRVSTHDICSMKAKSKHYPDRPGSDDGVKAPGEWIESRSRSIEKGERIITYRQLRHIL